MRGKGKHGPRTVGSLRELIAGLPDDTPICMRWADGAKDCEGDELGQFFEPYPRLRGFDVRSPKKEPVLQVRVDMQWLD
jgi:hypothetical protein